MRHSRDTATLLTRLSALVFCVALFLGAWFVGQRFFSRSEDSQTIAEAQDEPSLCHIRRSLDGLCVNSEDDRDPPLVAVMIDNHMDARPQAGLREARLVYEAPVEGNFSRFLAFFLAESDTKKAGPVRSARPYYLDWVSEYPGTPYFHVGGSPDALDLIKKYGIVNFNEFYYGGTYFWRSSARHAPYNTYISAGLWQKAREEKKSLLEINATTTPWRFGEEMEPCVSPDPVDECVPEISLTFLPNSFDVVWRYDVETGGYRREQAGAPHLDEDGEQITADTVIVERVETKTLDTVGRLSMETIGQGKAVVFRDGHAILGTWNKKSRTERTRFVALDGTEISLKPGKIWIEAVNQRGSVEF